MASVVNNTDVYNYILTNYIQPSGETRPTRFDSHKKSDLKNTYNRMVKANTDTPLYKINMGSNEVTKFAIDLKENSRFTENLISSLTADSGSMERVFHKKIATSSDEESVHVEYVGEDEDEPSSPSFEIGVKSLAKPQVNTGYFIMSQGRSFDTGAYTFDLDTTSNSYEFQFNVLDNDTNIDVQNRIARLINTSDVSLSASVVKGDEDTSALTITSKQTGLPEGEEFLFKISAPEGETSKELEILGIGNITSPAANSSFTLNGAAHSSGSNTFTINNDFEITLKSPSAKSASIGFKTSTDAISDSVEDLAKAFNNFLSIGARYETVGGDSQLKYEMNSLYKAFSGELESVGITQEPNGMLSVDREVLSAAVTGPDSATSFSTLNHFKDSLLRQSQKTAVNPMDYVNKVTVEYKNPGKTFASPYAASRFAGMLVDQSL